MKKSQRFTDPIDQRSAWASVETELKSSFEKNLLIATNLNTLKEIRSHWKNLVDSYRRKKKNLGVGVPRWPFYNMLTFLDQDEKDAGKTDGNEPDMSDETLEEEEDDEEQDPQVDQEARDANGEDAQERGPLVSPVDPSWPSLSDDDDSASFEGG